MNKEPIIEDRLSSYEVEIIHRFGVSWINNYDKFSRTHWEKALWLYAWDRQVIWNDFRRDVPIGCDLSN